MKRKLFTIVIILLLFSCQQNKQKNQFSTYFIVEAEHEIKFYEHYIYLDTTVNRKDSLSFIKKIIEYVDSVKAGKPVRSVSIVNKAFPQNFEDMDGPQVSRSTIFYVLFDEDSLKKGKSSVEEVKWHFNF